MEENKWNPGQPEQEEACAQGNSARPEEPCTCCKEEEAEPCTCCKEEEAEPCTCCKEEEAEPCACCSEEEAEPCTCCSEEEAEPCTCCGEEKKKAKKPRKPHLLFVRRNLMEWLSTLAFCVAILYAGYLVAAAIQVGATWADRLRIAGADPYSNLYLCVMVLFGIFAATLARRRSAGSLAVPSLLWLGMTGYKLWQPILLCINLYYLEKAGFVTMEEITGQYMEPILAVGIPYLLQFLCILGFLLYLCGVGNRWVHTVLCVLWIAAGSGNVLYYVQGGWRQVMPRILLVLAYTGAGLLLMLPVLCGKKVTGAQLREARNAERLAFVESIPVQGDAAAEDCGAADGDGMVEDCGGIPTIPLCDENGEELQEPGDEDEAAPCCDEDEAGACCDGAEELCPCCGDGEEKKED